MGSSSKSGWKQQVLWDLKFQRDEQLMAEQPEIVATGNEQKTVGVIDVPIPTQTLVYRHTWAPSSQQGTPLVPMAMD